MLVEECSDEDFEDEVFRPFLVVTLIQKYPQAESAKVHQPSVGSLLKRNSTIVHRPKNKVLKYAAVSV